MINVILRIAIGLTLFALNNGENARTTVTLTTVKSFAKYSPIFWNTSEDGSSLKFLYQLKTQSKIGTVVTVLAHSNQQFRLFVITLSVGEDRWMNVKIEDRNEVLLGMLKLKISENSNKVLHSSGQIDYNVRTQLLKIADDSNQQAKTQINTTDVSTDDNNYTTVNLTVIIGKFNAVESIVGCVTLEDFTLGNNKTISLERDENAEILEGCQAPCLTHNCNNGTCREIDGMAVCNCLGTLKSGEQCDQEAPTLKLDKDDYIAYHLTDIPNPTIIQFQFMTSSSNGLLLSTDFVDQANEQKLGTLKLILIDSKPHLSIGNFAEETFEKMEFTGERFHRFAIEFDYLTRAVILTIDEDTHKLKWIGDPNGPDLKFRDPVYFGNYHSNTGIAGCLREVYINHDDVISSYKQGMSRTFANEDLHSCVIHEPVVFDAEVQAAEARQSPLLIFAENEEKENDILENVEVTNIEEIVQIPATEEAIPESCDNSDLTFCKNHVGCVKNGSEAICTCKKGFVGKHCQFSVLPQNCDDVWAAGYTIPGTYIIDVDGSGPIEETYAFCEKGVTLITHNMPDNVLVKSNEKGDLQARINYRLFNKEALKALRDNSDTCKQTLTYKCNSAPLGLQANKTWFMSLDAKGFAFFPDKEGTCQCMNNKCDRCNCDLEAVATDVGRFDGEHAPVISVVSLVDGQVGSGYIHLSPFTCSGGAGRSKAYTATFNKRDETFSCGIWKGTYLSFEFRTYLTKTRLIFTENQELAVTLHHRHLHLLFYNNTITVTSQSRLNDGDWHRVTFEVIGDTARFSIDEIHTTFTLKSIFNQSLLLYIGGGIDAYLGCLRRLLIDENLKNFELVPGIKVGCENQCAYHECMHGSKCIENFETQEVYCQCKNNIIYSGNYCEKSINDGGEISLHDLNRGFLVVRESSPTALTDRYVFSIRTDRSDALLMYLHDHLYNFVQIHLSDHTRIVLTLNMNGSLVKNCEVITKPGKEFTRMQWLQIMLIQLKNKVILSVDDESCEIHGERTLSSVFIVKYQFEFDDEGVVRPPGSPTNTGFSQSFSLLYIGGVPIKYYKKANVQNNISPIYYSNIPTLLGCVRGFMIGNVQLDLRNTSYWSYYPDEKDAIREGCETNCEEVEEKCQNDGHCTYKWQNTNPSAKVTTCECSKTSYYGDYCEKGCQDTGMNFNGQSVLLFKCEELFATAYQVPDTDHILSFAFTTTKKSESQILATVFFKQDRRFDVLLLKNGSLNIQIRGTGAELLLHTFTFDYADGYRHFFYAVRNQRGDLIVTVDSSKYIIRTSAVKDFTLLDAVKFYFGGILELNSDDRYNETELAGKSNYTGCMSNIDINLNFGNMRYAPIRALAMPADVIYSNFVKIFGEPASIQGCGPFIVPGVKPEKQDNVIPPEWGSPFIVEPFIRPTILTTPAAPVVTTGTAESSSSVWKIGLIVVLLLLLLLVLFVVWLLCCRKKSKNMLTNTQEPKEENKLPLQSEQVPLLPVGKATQSEYPKIKNNYNVPQADASLDNAPENLKFAKVPCNTSLISFYTAQESFDSEEASQAFDDMDLDATLKGNDNDETIIDDDDFRSFNRSQPQRMSSFRRGDPTAPTDSPLYKQRIKRSPKPVLPPNSPVL